jgi:hypothetical protein
MYFLCWIPSWRWPERPKNTGGLSHVCVSLYLIIWRHKWFVPRYKWKYEYVNTLGYIGPICTMLKSLRYIHRNGVALPSTACPNQCISGIQGPHYHLKNRRNRTPNRLHTTQLEPHFDTATDLSTNTKLRSPWTHTYLVRIKMNFLRFYIPPLPWV